MPMSERAKQFMPFSPLKGLEEALKEKERETLKRSKAIVSPDHEDSLNRIMQEINLGDQVTITHYEKGVYINTCGEVEEININNRYFKIKDKIIMFYDVFDIVKS